MEVGGGEGNGNAKEREMRVGRREAYRRQKLELAEERENIN